ncbi:hypothetical protein [Bounagaea algeriensis]
MNDEEREDEDASEESPLVSEGRFEVFGRGVRTALRNNATAYGFSISLTAAYGLVNNASGAGSALETISFAFGAAVAFVLVGGLSVAYFPHGRLREGGQVTTLAGGFDILSVMGAITAAYGSSHLPGLAAWPATAFATVVAYLLVGGVDVLIARWVAQRSSFGESQ